LGEDEALEEELPYYTLPGERCEAISRQRAGHYRLRLDEGIIVNREKSTRTI